MRVCFCSLWIVKCMRFCLCILSCHWIVLSSASLHAWQDPQMLISKFPVLLGHWGGQCKQYKYSPLVGNMETWSHELHQPRSTLQHQHLLPKPGLPVVQVAFWLPLNFPWYMLQRPRHVTTWWQMKTWCTHACFGGNFSKLLNLKRRPLWIALLQFQATLQTSSGAQSWHDRAFPEA